MKIKFANTIIDPETFYVGEIVAWEQEEGKVRVYVRLDEFPQEEFLWTRRISTLRDSEFFTFCENMKLINHKEELVLQRLEKDEKVMVALNKMSNGVYLVREMYWASDFEGEEA